MTLKKLYKTILSRKRSMPKGSYVSSLFQEGADRVIQKLGEEAVEVVISAANKDKRQTIYELADLYFHSLVLMAYMEIKPEDIENELQRRSLSKIKKDDKVKEKK